MSKEIQLKTLHRNWLTTAFIGLAVLAVALIITLGVSGWRYFLIGSGSMQPTLPVGTIVVTQPVDSIDQLQRTDIITYNDADGNPVTHTFLEVLPDGSLLTKGDANPSPDAYTPPLTDDRLIGKVVLALKPLMLLGVVLLVAAAWLVLSHRRPDDEPTPDNEDADDDQDDHVTLDDLMSDK